MNFYLFRDRPTTTCSFAFMLTAKYVFIYHNLYKNMQDFKICDKKISLKNLKKLKNLESLNNGSISNSLNLLLCSHLKICKLYISKHVLLFNDSKMQCMNTEWLKWVYQHMTNKTKSMFLTSYFHELLQSMTNEF